jgi:hypothetical protein
MECSRKALGRRSFQPGEVQRAATFLSAHVKDMVARQDIQDVSLMQQVFSNGEPEESVGAAYVGIWPVAGPTCCCTCGVTPGSCTRTPSSISGRSFPDRRRSFWWLRFAPRDCPEAGDGPE